ncbi:MAG: hypothetical protein Q9166_003816 [cf. Caloplaca sp. 2 TL-2023]
MPKEIPKSSIRLKHRDQTASTRNLNDALWDVNALAHAGLNAIKYPDKPPYNYFFLPDEGDYVKGALERLVKFTEDPGSLQSVVNIDCNNPSLCGQNPDSDQWDSTRYIGTTHSTWTVTLRPYTLNVLERNMPSCTTSSGVPSLGWAMVKQLVQM